MQQHEQNVRQNVSQLFESAMLWQVATNAYLKSMIGEVNPLHS